MGESKPSNPDFDTEAIEEVLDSAPVELAVLFGSQARGDATAVSDVDVAVVFEESLASSDRTRARLTLLEQLDTVLDTDGIDVVPLEEAPPQLRREISRDGIPLVGSAEDLEPYCDETSPTETHAERLAEFDELLADLERIV